MEGLGGSSHGAPSLGGLHTGVQNMGTNLGLLVNGGGSGGGSSVSHNGGLNAGPLSPHDATLLASALNAPAFIPTNSVNYGMRYKRSDISSGFHWRP